MSISPPRTPGEDRLSAQFTAVKSTTPTSDTSSIIDDVSFDYVWDKQGNFIRKSKDEMSPKPDLGSNPSSPPTPPESPSQPEPVPKPPSPDILDSPLTKGPLSRSESAYPILTGSGAGAASTQTDMPVRLFQRVASGPAIAMASNLPPTTSTVQSKPRIVARRVTMEDGRDRQESVASSRSRQTLDSNAPNYALIEEKENISDADEIPHAEIQRASIATKMRSSPPLVTRSMSSASSRVPAARAAYLANGASSLGGKPLADVPVPQRTQYSRPNLAGTRAGRIMKTTSGAKYVSSSTAANFDRISELEASDNENAGSRYCPKVSVGGEDTEPEDEPARVAVDPAMIPLPAASIPSSMAPVGMVRSRTQLNVNTGASSSSLSVAGSNRPRRSASLSEAGLNNDEYQLQLQQQYQNPHSRPGTSLGLNGEPAVGARRIAAQQREKQGAEARAINQKYLAEAPERREHEVRQQQLSRQSPSPTHSQHAPSSKPVLGHKRRDSDTLRMAPPPLSATIMTGSPTVVEHQRASPPLSSRLQVRNSPPNGKGRISPISKGRASPPAATKGRVSPPTAKGRLSPNPVVAKELAKHRRSPTAPESRNLEVAPEKSQPVGKTWAAADRRDSNEEFEFAVPALPAGRERERERQQDREREREYQPDNRDRERRSHQPQLSLPQYPQSAPSIAGSSSQASNLQAPNLPGSRHMVVNKKAYARLDMIGKGGSSRVYRVLSAQNELYAVKRVSLDKTDAETMSGYMNEIALLKRLDGNRRIIRLIDSELKPGIHGGKGHLLLVMECGEIDLAKLLADQMKEKVSMIWVAYYWQQMLEAVQVIHEEKIVHSDLKPANFVLVRGQLKLIDFGIANAIANDTTNIQRDHQIGTVNYMSPEAIELPDGMRRLKVGRASDVWSLGCILYQMVYGHPPFQHLSVYQKMKAIPDSSYDIDYPEFTTPTVAPSRNSNGGANDAVEPPTKLEHLKQKVRPDVIETMKKCLCRNPKDRADITNDLLKDGWLTMQSVEPSPPNLKELLQEDETVIDPHYMSQLLVYGIKLAESSPDPSQEYLLSEAKRLVQELRAIRHQ
ncbi:Serine/threonine-protein kinase mph1 [Psilocybe cubensis]|uniref:Protein kinase domain-containing protein n=2 Tax=Psilocybe cubensis TaxID=181762 RepID=A0A8H7XP73_PSICU|nr:Serine/threonine-protein kinase mph1 [Psilocybe cubensis]KAH9480282.1 Serine/threonine-protein kinase mph1 [Psilocybe cubensis]